MPQINTAQSDVRKTAIYIGADGENFTRMAQALSLLYHVTQEELGPISWHTSSVDLVLLEAIGEDGVKAVSLIPAIRDAVGPAPIFVIIDNRDGDILFAATKRGINGFIEMPADLPNILSIIHREQQRRHGVFSGEICSFFSLKGGVGTTTISVNVAEQLALYTGGSAILLDLHMPLGDTSLYINAEEQKSYTINDFIQNIHGLDEELLDSSIGRHESGLRYLALPQNLAELENVTDVNIKMVLTLLRQHYNYIIIDCASNFSPITLACLDESSTIMLVSEPSLSSMRAVRVAYDTCLQLGYPAERLKLIFNRKTSQGGELINKLLDALGIAVSAEIENNYLIFVEA
ncbi:MAG: AAA family ATPase, partial [Desulfobulbaceae bacterium]|nr:AAA family ATPase [Desulfobulbaceae bacterium]